MSYYGPPGEPNRPQPEDYGPPSDPWGTAPAVDGWGAYDNPPYADPPYPPYQKGPAGPGEQEDNWAPPPPPLPPPRRSSGLYVLVAVLVVLAASGVGYALYLLSAEGGDRDDRADDPTAAPSVTAAPSGSTAPSSSPDNIGLNAATAQVDDCLINDGTAEQPQMRVVRCDGDEDGQVFRVLAIFEEQVEGEGAEANEQAQDICADTEGYRYHYYEVSDNASFVLCMTDRDA